MGDIWNHNEHYYETLLQNVPLGCELALDVGCGEGSLTAKLSQLSTMTIGIDRHPASIDVAKSRCPTAHFICDDFLTADLEEKSYDFVVCAMALHHMDFERAIDKMKRLLRRNGTLAILGIGRSSSATDFALATLGITTSIVFRLARTYAEHGAPKIRPKMTYSEVKTRSLQILPCRTYQRHLMFRYTIVWSNDCGSGAGD